MCHGHFLDNTTKEVSLGISVSYAVLGCLYVGDVVSPEEEVRISSEIVSVSLDGIHFWVLHVQNNIFNDQKLLHWKDLLSFPF